MGYLSLRDALAYNEEWVTTASEFNVSLQK